MRYYIVAGIVVLFWTMVILLWVQAKDESSPSLRKKDFDGSL